MLKDWGLGIADCGLRIADWGCWIADVVWRMLEFGLRISLA